MSDLSGIKVGDVVLIDGYGLTKAVVSRITKLHIITESGAKYRINGGRKVGEHDVWHHVRLIPFDESRYQQFLDKQRTDRIRDRLSRLNWASLDREILESVYAIIFPQKERTS